MQARIENTWLLRWSGILLGAFLCVLTSGTSLWADVIVVANEHGGTLSILNSKARENVGTLEVGGDPHNLAVTSDGRRAVVTHPSAGMVTILDPRLPRVLKRLKISGRPHGVAVSPDDRWAFVGAETDRKVYVVDLQPLDLHRTFAVEPALHNLVITNAGLAWMTALRERFLWLVDVKDGTLVSRLETAARPHDLALARRGDALWVVSWGSGEVFLVHGQPPQVEKIQISGRQPHHVVITPDEREVWVTNHGSEDISVIDALAQRELTRIAVGKAPHHVAFSVDGRWAFVANSGSDDVSIVDVAKRREVGRLPAGAHPHGIVVVPNTR